MSAPYPWIKDSGDILGAPTGRLAITSTNGIYLSTSTNSSILGPTNADLSIESQGTGDIILKTNSNNRLTINDSGDVTSSKNLIVNNSSVGGSANPLLTLNLTNLSGTTIVQEVYNQKTAAIGTIYDSFYNAKDSAGNKIQYANINVSAPSIISTSSRGAMAFGLKDFASGNSPYIQLNGATARVTILRQLNMQNNILMNSSNIQTCSEITAPSGSKYTPQFVQYLNANGTFIPTAEPNTRQVLVSTISGTAGWLDAINSGVQPLPSNDDPTASAIFAGAWWVGTRQGNLYYSFDSGNTWNSFGYQMSGEIYVLYPFNSGNYLAVGGSFSWQFSNAFYIDSGLNYYDFTNGGNGFNDPVYTFCDNTTYGILYIGGRFSANGFGFPLNNYYWWNWDYINNQGYEWDDNQSTGFQNGSVRSITFDSNSGFFVVGGDFTDFKNSNLPYLVSVQLNSGPLFGINMSGYWGFGFQPNSPVYSVVPWNSGVLVGGYFTNPFVNPSWNTNYGLYAVWNGSNWDLYDYPYFSPGSPISAIYFIPTTGAYYSVLENGSFDELYLDSTLLPSIPTGSRWKNVNYNGSFTTFATDSQSGVGFPFYILNISSSVSVDLISVGAIVVVNGTEYTNNITLSGLGSTCETIYFPTDNKWYVISTTGSVVFT